jgi:hypothetical protein
VKFKLLRIVVFEPVSNLRVVAVILSSSVASKESSPDSFVPRLIDLDEVNGSNFTAPVPAFIDPVRFTLLALTTTSVFVTARADSISRPAVEVEASKTMFTLPVDENVPVLRAGESLVTEDDLVDE